MILCKASQTAISKAVCYKTKNEQLREKAVHFLLVAINCFYAGLPTVFCTITTSVPMPRSFGEPSLSYSFALMEKFKDTPERRECNDTKNC